LSEPRVQAFITTGPVTTGVGTLTPDQPFGAGNCLEVRVSTDSSGAVSVSAPGCTFTPIAEHTDGGGNQSFVFLATDLPATEPTVTVTWPTGSGHNLQAIATEWTGLTPSPFVQFSAGDTVFANATTAPITTTAGNVLSGGFTDSFGGNAEGSFSAGTGEQSGQLSGYASPPTWAADYIPSGPGGTVTYTSNGSRGFTNAIMVEYAAASETTRDAMFFGST
jgi:hypothetical protein